MVERGVKVIRPEILDQIPLRSKCDAEIRRITAGENTSSFYSHVYGSIRSTGQRIIPPLREIRVNGEPIPNRTFLFFPWQDPDFPDRKDQRDFRPDVIDTRRTGRGYTELKAVSTRTSHPGLGVRQFETYAFALLWRRAQGDEVPWLNYAFARYGDFYTNGQHKHENGSLVKELAGSTRDMIVFPSNLLFYSLMVSPKKGRNQGETVRRYWEIRASTINAFMEYDPEKACQVALKDARTAMSKHLKKIFLPNPYGWEKDLDARLTFLEKPRNMKRVIADLSLESLARKQETSPPMRTYAGDEITEFPITRFKTPRDEYQNWLNRLMDPVARKTIFRRINATDLYGKLQEYERKNPDSEFTLSVKGNTSYLIRSKDPRKPVDLRDLASRKIMAGKVPF